MPVYHKHKLIHIHIPKTAGTAIEQSFYRADDMDWGPHCWFGPSHKNDRWYEYQHLSLDELRTLASSRFEGYTSFAVVRNPYARLVSDYAWQRWMQEHHPNTARQFFDTFEAFLSAIPKDIGVNWDEYIVKAERTWANFLIHQRPQFQYVSNHDEIGKVDRVLKFECLDQELREFLQQYGLNTAWIKKPPKRDLEKYFDRKRLDLVNAIYQKDFELFGYPML